MLMFVWLLLIHFIADFMFQTRTMAENKSKDITVLGQHCCIIWVFLAFGTGNLIFATVNALLHGIIDRNIWLTYKKDKKKDFEFWKDDVFYSTIGFDQFLHTSILMITWEILK